MSADRPGFYPTHTSEFSAPAPAFPRFPLHSQMEPPTLHEVAEFANFLANNPEQLHSVIEQDVHLQGLWDTFRRTMGWRSKSHHQHYEPKPHPYQHRYSHKHDPRKQHSYNDTTDFEGVHGSHRDGFDQREYYHSSNHYPENDDNGSYEAPFPTRPQPMAINTKGLVQGESRLESSILQRYK